MENSTSVLRQKFHQLSIPQTLVLYYFIAILCGALLLRTPFAAHGAPLSFLDALFTATSAQCVTGLVVVDTGTKLTLFGQMVVLILIQIGGLGIMTFSVYLFVYLRMGVSTRGRWIINETLMHSPISTWRELIHSVVMLTLAIEALGAVVLAWVLVPKLGLWVGIYSAIFHSISAFCNAGFSLFSDSMVQFSANSLLNATLITLIILGGIGFLVLRELLGAARQWRKSPRKPVRISLHSKIVLCASAFLIVYGTLMIAWLEQDNTLAGLSFLEGFWTSLFQSVTARTAGFNTLDLTQFRAPTLFFMIFLMFVGASPGSAGGGIKTTSMALFFAVFYSRLRGSSHVTLFRRTIPDEAITKALALTILAITLVALAIFCLMCAHTPDVAHEGSREFLSYTFEAFSAFATVGLSMGATAELNHAGKIIVIGLMFVGRVGMLTMAFAIAGRVNRFAPRYAEENIMIG